MVKMCKHGNEGSTCPLCFKVIKKVKNSSVQIYFIDKTDSTLRRVKNLTKRVFKNDKCLLDMQ